MVFTNKKTKWNTQITTTCCKLNNFRLYLPILEYLKINLNKICFDIDLIKKEEKNLKNKNKESFIMK